MTWKITTIIKEVYFYILINQLIGFGNLKWLENDSFNFIFLINKFFITFLKNQLIGFSNLKWREKLLYNFFNK